MSAVIATLAVFMIVFMTVATAFALSASYQYDELDRLKTVV